ncbi:MAG: excisionase [Clostridium sp.]|nr:excisionase [Clostridium sp.]MCM1207732.1 excisionase [Ruminococcus sp.]
MTELQEERQEILQMPWWNKFTLSVQETANYFGFSDKKVRKIIDENENAAFVLWNGTRPRIKKDLFAQFVNEKLTAI